MRIYIIYCTSRCASFLHERATYVGVIRRRRPAGMSGRVRISRGWDTRLVTEHPFRVPKWTSSSLERPFQEIAGDERGEGGRCMRGGVRVSTKRYSSRLDGNEARIEILSSSLSFSLCLAFSLVVPASSFLSLSVSRSLFTPLYGPMNSRGIIVASFVPFDYLGTIQACENVLIRVIAETWA